MDDRGQRAAAAGETDGAPAGRAGVAALGVHPSGSRWAGVVGGAAAVVVAPIFLAAITTGGLRQPGFDQWASFVSELGADGSPAAAVTNASFAGVGVGLLLFAAGVGREVPGRGIGPLVAVPGAAFLVLAVSPCSAGCPIALVDAGATTADAIHNAAATAGLLALSLAAMRMAERAPEGFGPSWYRGFSAAAGATVGIAGALFGLAVLVDWSGGIAVFERFMLLAAMAWTTVTGGLLVRSARRSASGRPAGGAGPQ